MLWSQVAAKNQSVCWSLNGLTSGNMLLPVSCLTARSRGGVPTVCRGWRVAVLACCISGVHALPTDWFLSGTATLVEGGACANAADAKFFARENATAFTCDMVGCGSETWGNLKESTACVVRNRDMHVLISRTCANACTSLDQTQVMKVQVEHPNICICRQTQQCEHART